jgi:hypothetical protein
MQTQPIYADLLPAARQRADPPADAWLATAIGQPEAKTRLLHALQAGGDHLWQLVASEAPLLVAQIETWPVYAPRYWPAATAQIFKDKGPDILLLLGLYSLPYCYAAADGAAVLAATERLASPAQALKRLQETATFVQTVLSGSVTDARQACLQVRVIHALTRWHLKAKEWDEAILGLHINQEDMAGTLLSFGYLTARGLRKLGAPLSPAETEAYLGWFSVLGLWLGVEPALAPATQAQANQLAQAIEQRHHRASPQGKQLTTALLQAFSDAEVPAWVAAQAPKWMAALLGPALAPMLGLTPAPETALANLKLYNLARGLGLPLGISPAQAQREALRHPLSQEHKP